MSCGLLEHSEGDDTCPVVSDGVEEGADLLDVRLLIPGWRVRGISAKGLKPETLFAYDWALKEPVSPEIGFRVSRFSVYEECTAPRNLNPLAVIG